jgi:two-component system chemotaxis response regulator CheB
VIRVLVVEDSATQRHHLVTVIQQAPDMAVVGQARDGLEAIQLVEKLRPDVISMDVRMPHLGGIEATQRIMSSFPTPVVVVSSAANDSDLTMQAMQAGALAALEKPPATTHPDFKARSEQLISMLRLMAGVRVIRHLNLPRVAALQGAGSTAQSLLDSKPYLRLVRSHPSTPPEIVVIGTSAGGPSALAELLSSLPPDYGLPVIVVQHLTAEFMPGLAEWLNRACSLPVRLAQHGERPAPGVVLLAPGNAHLRFSAERRIVLDSNNEGYRHQPAVDVLLESTALYYASRAIGVVLTGMGDDGAAGLRAMRDTTARTIVQDEESCVVFGMPAAAIAAGGAEFVLPLDKIAAAILKLSGRGEGQR